MSNAESREAEELMEAETSEELSYLVDQVIMFVGDMTHSDVTWLIHLWYGVATISRLLKIIGLFWRISSVL